MIPILPYRIKKCAFAARALLSAIAAGFVLLVLPAVHSRAFAAPLPQYFPTSLAGTAEVDIERLEKTLADVWKVTSVLSTDQQTVSHRITELSAMQAEASRWTEADNPWGASQKEVAPYKERTSERISELIGAYLNMDTEHKPAGEHAHDDTRKNDPAATLLLAGINVQRDGVPIAIYDLVYQKLRRVKGGLDKDIEYNVIQGDKELRAAMEDLDEAARQKQSLEAHNDETKKREYALLMANLDYELQLVSLVNKATTDCSNLEYVKKQIVIYQRQWDYLTDMRPYVQFSEETLRETERRLDEEIEARSQTAKVLAKMAAEEEAIAKGVLDERGESLYDAVEAGTIDRLIMLAPFSAKAAERALIAAKYYKADLKAFFAQQVIQDLSLCKTLWNTRYKLFHKSLDSPGFWKTRTTLQNEMAEWANYNSYYDRKVGEINSYERLAVEGMIHAAPEARKPMQEMQLQFRELAGYMYNVFAVAFFRKGELIAAAHEEINQQIGAQRLSQHFSQVLTEHAKRIRNTVIVDYKDVSLTVGELSFVVFLILVGSVLSGFLGAPLRKLLIKIVRDATVAAAVQRLFFGVMWILLIVEAMDAVNIPLGGAAFIGGAVIVAIGYGSKDLAVGLMNSFVLIFGRSMKVNDIVSIGAITGRVEHIGSKSLLVRTADNQDVEIPMHTLSSEKIVNYTRFGVEVRCKLTISILRKYARKSTQQELLAAAQTSAKILKFPEPYVQIGGFDDSKVNYEIVYWFDISRDKTEVVAAELRSDILQHFGAKGAGFILVGSPPAGSPKST